MFVTAIDSPNVNDVDYELHKEIRASVDRLMRSGEWANYHSPILDELRNEISSQLATSHVRLTSSGSLAVELALRGCGVREGDEVICPALDYPGNVRAIRLLGASPVIVDTSAERWTIDVEQAARAGTEKTRAVVVSHLYGEIADVTRLRTLCDERNWKLVEDACQMPVGFVGPMRLGSLGDVAAFSFGGSKPFTAGCGGAVVTNDTLIAQRISTFTDRPSDAFAFSPLQATMLLPQWKRGRTLAERQMLNLRELIARCQPETPTWHWPSIDYQSALRCYYKIPIRVIASNVDEKHKNRRPDLLASMSSQSILAGEPFRVVTRAVANRGRIHSFENALRAADQTILLDHRNLAGSSESLRSLADRFVAIYHEQALS